MGTIWSITPGFDGDVTIAVIEDGIADNGIRQVEVVQVHEPCRDLAATAPRDLRARQVSDAAKERQFLPGYGIRVLFC